jgi:hypothetical protein
MVFDKANSRWVRNASRPAPGNTDEPSEDPFVDIESLRDDSRREGETDDSDGSQEDGTARQGPYPVVSDMTRIEERTEMDEEEVDLMSFSTDASSHVVNVMTGMDPNAVEDDAETTESDDNVELVQPEIRPLEFDSEDEDFHFTDVPKVIITQETNPTPSNLESPLPPLSLATP